MPSISRREYFDGTYAKHLFQSCNVYQLLLNVYNQIAKIHEHVFFSKMGFYINCTNNIAKWPMIAVEKQYVQAPQLRHPNQNLVEQFKMNL